MESNLSNIIHICLLNNINIKFAYIIEKKYGFLPWTKKSFFSILKDNYLNYYLSIDNLLIGFVITRIASNEADLLKIVIDLNYRRKKLGYTLLSFVINKLKKIGVYKIWLEVSVLNKKAIFLYKKLKFRLILIRKNYYFTNKRYEDAFLMSLFLNKKI